jgi:hypothetical protein
MRRPVGRRLGQARHETRPLADIVLGQLFVGEELEREGQAVLELGDGGALG